MKKNNMGHGIKKLITKKTCTYCSNGSYGKRYCGICHHGAAVGKK